MTDIATTQRWVAARRSAKEAAKALVGLTLRRRRWWVYVACVELALALVIGVSFDDRYGTGVRVLWGPVYALVPTSVLASVGLAGGYLLNRQAFGRRLREGVVLESEIGDRVLVLRGPLASSTLSFDGIAGVWSSGAWVFLKQVGSPVLSVWPAELFPPADLARLRRDVRARAS